MDSRPTQAFQAGTWIKESGYNSFLPNLINRQWIIEEPDLQVLIQEAGRYLGELNAFSQLVPDIEFYIKMHVAKEATLSSRIEGTQTSIEETFLEKEDLNPEQRNDWQEVQNYIQAINASIDKMEELPLSGRLIRHAHEILMQGVRGERKQPGQFRTSQNWIGGSSLRDATFIPPRAHEVPELIGDLEKFLHNEDIFISELVRIAIVHYQFETIHPFLDGNGRVGRVLITLSMMNKGLLVRPTLYLSAFFNRNRQAYYDKLMDARTRNDLNGWLRFFMNGVITTAKNATETFRQILALKTQIDTETLPSLGRKFKTAQQLMNHLYTKPVFTVREVETWLSVSRPTANALVRALAETGMLEEMTGYRRNRVFVFGAYVRLFGG